MIRAVGMALVVLLASAAGVARSQQPPATQPNGRPQARPADDLLDNEIDVLLRRWHDKTSKVKHLYADFVRTTRDAAFGNVQTNRGSARYRYPNLARLDITEDAQGRGSEHLILTEQMRAKGKRMEIWHYKVIEAEEADKKQGKKSRGQLVVRFYTNPRQERDLAEEGPLKLIFGLEPAEAHARYDFRIEGKDADSTQVKVIPKRRADKDDFTEADLWLRHKTSLPKHLRLRSKTELIDYDFELLATDVDHKDLVIDVSDFTPIQPSKAKDGVLPNSKVLWNMIVAPIDDPPANPNAGQIRPANAQVPDDRRNRP